ncbi:MAG: TonB-dependent receptor [Bacteroidetes bacterium]|nr:TonB-dependent receptor [Bacteroidota bacterium]
MNHKKENRNLFLSTIYILLCFISFTSISFSQVSGKLTGTVKDLTGELLVGANIILEGTYLGAATNFEGRYTILNVRAGTYTVKIRYIGYKMQVFENVRISADQTKILDAVLEPEVIEGEEVIVVAQRPLVEFNQTSSVSTINKDEIKNLPVQTLNDIVNLQAGVINGHFRGGRLGEVQYQVDGVSVVNPYNNSSILEIDRSMIEEVQVISGTFDAKYGQAMSGVVNAVLKTGGDRFQLSGESYIGDYYPADTERYPNNESYNPIKIQSYQLSLSGPTGLPQTTFFINGRRFFSQGWMFGKRMFIPFDENDFEKRKFNPTGDNKIEPMNSNYEWSGQAKITNQSIKYLQFNYQITFNNSQRKYYNHGFRLNPDGIPTNYTTSLSHGLTFTHTLSPLMFYILNFRQNFFQYESYVYKDLMDPKYLEAGQPKGDANFEEGAVIQGVDLGRFRQTTNLGVVKIDFTWQADKLNFIEGGIEGQYSEIVFGPPGFFVTTNIEGVEVLQPRYQFPRLPGLKTYFPKQFSSYIQDRIELGDLVVRAGLRFEYFDAAGKIPSDLQNPANTITGAPESKLINTKIKTALAPRLGLSFPITASASIYFSYGHFSQLPGLNLLYSNADYSLLDQLQAGGISYGVMGNPDLNSELTVQYEFGLKQAVADFLGVQLSFFYKNIRDLLGVEFVSTYTAAEYARFTNVDFGSVYGLTLSLFQRNISYFNTSLDYTLQFAQGNSSDSRETANRAAAGQDPRPRDLPFNWDQRHTLNLSAVYSVPEDYSLAVIFRFGSGQPYTPEIGSGFGAAQETNSGRKESYFLLDLRAEKYFNMGIIEFSLFARAFNVFNTHFVNGFVFNSTGSPDYSLTPSANRAALFDPSRFYEPRRIEFGISFRRN